MSKVIFRKSYTLMSPMPGNNEPVGTVYHIGDTVTDDIIIAQLLSANAPISIIVDDFGTAALKNASDNTKPTVASVSGATVAGNIAIFNDIAGTVAEGPVAGNKVLTSSLVSPDVGSNLIAFSVTVDVSALNVFPFDVTLVPSSGFKQYRILSLQLNSQGTNFQGGGGDRLGQVTDTVSAYSVIPAATMQSLVNARWGDTALPLPASIPMSTSTAPGNSLVFAYSGGTTNYTTGSLVITGLVQRTA